MNIDLYSDRAKQAVQSAQSLALARGHQQFAPEHLLKVLLEEKDGLSRALIQSAGGRPDAVDAATETLLAKTPLSVLIFFAAGVVYSLKEGRKSHIWVYAPLILYFTFALNSKLQIGVRHILPALPFCLVLAGAGAAALLDRKYPRWAAAFLLAALVFSAAKVNPHYLAYFNQLSGGPSEGYKYFVDSNLDWGQGVKELAAHLKEKGNPPVIFAYFGTARPEAYGVKYAPLGLLSNVEMRGTGERVCGMRDLLLAVSGELQNDAVNRLQLGGEYLAGNTEGRGNFLAFRAGYQVNYPDPRLSGLTGLTLGLGYTVNRSITLDYAMVPVGELGTSHRFSLIFKFGYQKPL